MLNAEALDAFSQHPAAAINKYVLPQLQNITCNIQLIPRMQNASATEAFQENDMQRKLVRMILSYAVVLAAAWQAYAQSNKTHYPTMAPVDQYFMADQNAEIALARSAAPKSIADHAEVLVMGRHGYETAVKGTNGFVCLVERSWTAGIDDVDFWNPKLRGPLCLNAPAARSYLPITLMKTRLILAGKSKKQVFDAVGAALDQKKLSSIEPGAMCYMLSKQGYLADAGGHWHPHLMFFTPLTQASSWGANSPGSPVLAARVPEDRLTIFMIPVAKWSDGTPDSNPQR